MKVCSMCMLPVKEEDEEPGIEYCKCHREGMRRRSRK